MRKIMIYLLLLTVIALSAGCGQADVPEQPVITETVQLFYGSEGNEEFVSEDRQITYREGADKYEATLKALIQGPENPAFVANIPGNTGVYGTIRQNNSIIVNLTGGLLNFGGSVAEIVAVGSIVNTLAQFDEIERVKILVEGEEYVGPSGEARGFMEPFTMDEVDTEVILYFSNEQATAVVAETRTISIPHAATREDILEIVLAELIEGPQGTQVHRTIPEEVTVVSIAIDNNIAIVDFSEEMHTRHWGGAAGESMTINSLVNTITEFEGIDYVKMTVAGEPMNIEHAILEDPLPRNEAMIER